MFTMIFLIAFGTTPKAAFGVPFDIALDSQGNIIIAGATDQSDMVTKNAHQETFGGVSDIYLIKLSQSYELIWSTYFGGTEDERKSRIAIGPDDSIYLVADTDSSGLATGGAFQTQKAGIETNLIISKFSTEGELIFSTYFGGSTGADIPGYQPFPVTRIGFIAVDGGGDLVLTGETQCVDLPVTGNALQPEYGGGKYDTFIAKISSNGSSMLYSTYLGGSSIDRGLAIGIDDAKNIFIAGLTFSENFPTKSAVQSAKRGSIDAFITKFTKDGAIIFSTYLGAQGSYLEDDTQARSLAVFYDGSVYVAGLTSCDDFPTTASAYKATKTGGYDGFITKFTPTGEISFSTLFGGDKNDYALDIALDAGGNCFVTGDNGSGSWATQNAYQPQSVGGYDNFFAKISSDGSALEAATFIGGAESSDWGYGIAFRNNKVYLVGHTFSNDFPVTGDVLQSVKGNVDGTFSVLTGDATTLVYSTFVPKVKSATTTTTTTTSTTTTSATTSTSATTTISPTTSTTTGSSSTSPTTTSTPTTSTTTTTIPSAAPTATTGLATSVTSTSAILNGSVNPNGSSTEVYFEYGTTTNYGFSPPAEDIGAGTSFVTVNASISNLVSDTIYHYRVVATNGSGTSFGADNTFYTVIVYVSSDDSCGGNIPCYSTIQAAIDAAETESVIRILQGTFDEDIIMDQTYGLTLSGGWDSTFTTQSSNTVFNSLTTTGTSGTVEIENITLR